MIFYTADLHLGDPGVLKLSNRPFSTIQEHDNFIIDTWNATVSDNDTIYIVGDISYRSKVDIGSYLKTLKGHKHILIGNHDLKFKDINYKNRKYFESIEQMIMVKDGEHQVILCHYPLAEWSGYFRGSYMVHGHIHNNTASSAFQYLKTEDKALNAGVDINNFKPVTLKELIFNNKLFKEGA